MYVWLLPFVKVLPSIVWKRAEPFAQITPNAYATALSKGKERIADAADDQEKHSLMLMIMWKIAEALVGHNYLVQTKAVPSKGTELSEQKGLLWDAKAA